MHRVYSSLKSDKLRRGPSNVQLPLRNGNTYFPCYVQDLETTLVYKVLSANENTLQCVNPEGEFCTIQVTRGTYCRVRYVGVSRFVVRSLV